MADNNFVVMFRYEPCSPLKSMLLKKDKVSLILQLRFRRYDFNMSFSALFQPLHVVNEKVSNIQSILGMLIVIYYKRLF